MKKAIVLIISIFCISFLSAQTGIGTTTPNASAKLDVSSSNKGFLPPRISLTDIYDQTTIPSPATGLLVYCKGDAGLAAGYYYWNGNAWATIATAGGSGSFAASFLRGSRSSSQSVAKDGIVSFSTVDNSAGQDISLNTTNGKITLAPGNTYRLIAAVPTFTSGQRPSFMWYNETTTSYIGSASSTYNTGDAASYGAFGVIAHVIITPSVSTVLSFRMLSSLSNGSVTVGGNSDFSTTGSYPWFEAQVISGNAPITGQSVDYVSTSLNANVSSVGSNTDIILQQFNGGNIPYNSSTGVYSLSANKTYMMQAQLRVNTASVSNAYLQYTWVDAATNTPLVANSEALNASSTSGSGYGSKEVVQIIYTPTTNQTIKLRSTSSSGTQTIVLGSVNIIQIGSSAIINPWVLSGNDVYNTTGEVGIGTSSPSSSALLDISSTNKGILIPRLTSSQKNAISSPTTGLLIYQTDAPAGFYYYNGSSWISIINPGTTTRFLPHSSNFTHLSAGQSLTSLASGSYVAIGSSDLVIDVPSGYTSNKVVIKWDTWGDVTASSAAHGSFRYQIKQTGTSTATYGSAAMNGWAVTGSSVAATRFATPVTYILTDLAPGTYTFKLEISREAEVGTITNMNNYHVSGSVQVFVK
jgi:hypothetical protein